MTPTRTLIAATLFGVACGAKSAERASTGGPAAPLETRATDDVPQGEIVTAEIERINGPAYGKPPVEFRKGSVTPIPAPKPTKTATGFQVQFASRATIVTPTVYERSVIVSGGFSSKELYAYDAVTGTNQWAIDLHDDGPSSPACERGVCVVNTESCTIFAIEAKTGKQLWSYWLGDPLTSAPTIAGNRVFASYPASTTSDGKPKAAEASHVLAAFDLKTGKILWQIWLDSDVMSAPVAVDGFVYATTFAGTLVKLEQATGKLRYAMRARATSAPVVQFVDGVEQTYYTRRADSPSNGAGAKRASEPAPAAEESLIRADHNDPKTKYESQRKKADYIDSAAQEKSDYAAKSKAEDAANGFSGGAPASAGAQYAFSNVGVSSVSSMQNFQGSRVVKLRDKSVNTMGDEVIATNSETGATMWKFKLPGNSAQAGGFLGTAPLAAGNSILFGTLDGKVVRLDQRTGKQLATYAVGGHVRSQPVVANGWIYVGTEDGRLVAIDTKDATVTGWPTWGGNAQRTGIAR
jgi:Ca-activated chloride channel homolog